MLISISWDVATRVAGEIYRFLFSFAPIVRFVGLGNISHIDRTWKFLLGVGDDSLNTTILAINDGREGIVLNDLVAIAARAIPAGRIRDERRLSFLNLIVNGQRHCLVLMSCWGSGLFVAALWLERYLRVVHFDFDGFGHDCG